jgi:site-specific DNA recombinase
MAEPVEHPAKGWAGTYGRKSNLPRAFQSNSPENQDRITKHAALIHGLRIKPGYEFFDVKSASKDVRRQGFEGAVAALMNREIEALIVPKLDRLSRRGMGQIGLLLDHLRRRRSRLLQAEC